MSAYTVAPTYLFTHPDQVRRIAIPEGHRVVAFVRGVTPQVGPAEEAGVYEIGCPRRADAAHEFVALPMVMIVVPSSHVAALLATSREAVDDMIDQIQDAIEQPSAQTSPAPRTIQ